MHTDFLEKAKSYCDEFSGYPLDLIAAPFIRYLNCQEYADSTTQKYLSAVAHFSFWMNQESFVLKDIDKAVIDQFLRSHVPLCSCPAPFNSCNKANLRAALNHLLAVLQHTGLVLSPVHSPKLPVDVELGRFHNYLMNTRGLAQSTSNSRINHIHHLLLSCFGAGKVDASRMAVSDIERFIETYARSWKPACLVTLRSDLKSYLRYRVLNGDQMQSLIAALPVIANFPCKKLPHLLTDTEIETLLQAFDLQTPIGLRDYAIIRCFIDLGLRGHEVACLRLESLDWYRGVLTISQSKVRRVHQLPIPEQTGEAIVQYLRHGRPVTKDRRLFVRHIAPISKPLSVGAIRNVIFRALRRCGLDEHLYRSHAFRRAFAMRLQRSGASLKEIADILRHLNLQTTTIYAKADLHKLLEVALPWPGRLT